MLAMFLGVAYIYRGLIAGRVLAGGDLQTYFFPYWATAARALHARELPLWNPYLFTGAPLLANSQAGIFYPLNWILWAVSPLTLAGLTRTLHWSVLLHLGLAAGNSYFLARAWGVSRPGAALSGLIYAGSGYLGIQVEHLNQLQGLAWLPLLFWPAEVDPPSAHPRRDRWLPVLSLAMILLAGHSQTAFIALAGMILWRGVWAWLTRTPFRRWVTSLLPFALSVALAAVQLWPTLMLIRYSTRSGGLSWREAVSFSIPPWDLPRALLPPYVRPPLLPEGVAYLGIAAWLLGGWGLVRLWRTRRTEARAWRLAVAWLIVGGAGLFLALGGYNPLYLAAVKLRLPGTVQFRAPARYLSLYVLAGSQLVGAAYSWTKSRRLLRESVAVLVLLELIFCASYLPHAHATAPRAYTDFRPAMAHLVSAAQDELVPGRYLSISKTLFDLGDKAEIEAIYGAALSPDALWAYEVAAKQREVLAPNLSQAFMVPAVDGYDGGLLPLKTYVTFSRLLLPNGTPDGRLRENLDAIPEGRWLSLLDVRFLVTDKIGDTWADGVFYDRQFHPRLDAGQTLTPVWLPPDFEATAVGLIYGGSGTLHVATPEQVITLTLAEHITATVGRASWGTPVRPLTITLQAGEHGLTPSGLSLLDERTGAFYPLTLSDRFRLVHSGDVKIYENMHRLPRAYLVHQATVAATDEEVLTLLRDPHFDPAAQVVLDASGARGLTPAPALSADERATIVTYTQSHVTISVTVRSTATLLLTDAWYPTWHVTLIPQEGGAAQPWPLQRADILFRAVTLPPGRWLVKMDMRYW